MAPSSRCQRYLTLVADILFMVLGVALVVLVLALLLPLVSLLSVPRWLLPPLCLPLLPAVLALPLGFVAFSATRSATSATSANGANGADIQWRLAGVSALQVALSLCMAVLAGWQVYLGFSPRIATDLAALMNDSLHDTKWHTVFPELKCCGPLGPASFSFHGSAGIPSACCSKDADGPCSRLYTQGCVGPAADRVRGVLRDEAAANGGAALLMFLCALSTAFYVDALKRERKKRREAKETQQDKPLTSPMLNQRF